MNKKCILCGDEALVMSAFEKPLCQMCFQKQDICVFCSSAILPGEEEKGYAGNGRCSKCAAEGCTEEDL